MTSTHQLTLIAAAWMALAHGAHAQAIQEYEYQSDRIYPVHAGLGITTQIELSAHEKILDYSTGFSSGWELTRRDNVFYLKPRNVDVDTNMMIRTETHAYILELKVAATDWKTLDAARTAGVHYKVRFSYPSDAHFSSQAAKAERAPELDTTLVPGRRYHFDYDYAARGTGAPWLVPASVHDDARFTYLRMADLQKYPTGSFPSVAMRQSERGEDAVVNSTVEGNTIVVHGTYPYLVIRHGNDVVGLRRNTAP
jgi:type IV secretion system protein VirB9